MKLHFHKMHGLGNDFVVIDGIHQSFSLNADQIRTLAHRHTGIGFDQLLLVEPPPDGESDFSYRIFNADGSEVNQCGNGARCFARFVYETGLTHKTTIRVATRNGHLTLNLVGDQVQVNLGQPRFAPAEIPFKVSAEAPSYSLDLVVDDQSQRIEVGAVSMGNPHVVLQVATVNTAPVSTWGPILETHPQFPEKVNVGFMEIVRRDAINLRVFERGVGETLACGSGACAAVVVGQRWGKLDNTVTVSLRGGQLTVSQRENEVYLQGPAIFVYQGDVEV